MTLGGAQVYQSPQNLGDAGGWTFCSGVVTPTATSALLLFQTVSTTINDTSILVDSVLVNRANVVPATAGSLSVANGATPTFTANSFESPVLNASTYGSGITMQMWIFNPPITPAQPWTFTNTLGGIAFTGSPYDPPAPAAPPAGSQYAFLQTSPNSRTGFQTSSMSTTLTGLNTGSTYVVSFFWAARAASNDESEPGYDTESQITVTVNGVNVYTSGQNLVDSAGWTQVVSNQFTASGSSLPIVFAVNSQSNNDHTILLDTIIVAAPGSFPVITPTNPVVTGSLAVGTLGTFESPNNLNPSYLYNPTVTVLQPWIWSNGLGGVAEVGSPFDPPPPTVNPSPDQYAFLQTDPSQTPGEQNSNMSTTITGLIAGTSYNVSFWLATRANNGQAGANATHSQLTVTLGGAQVYQSPQNLGDAGGWTFCSGVVTPTATSALLLFQTVSTTINDTSILVDSVLVNPVSFVPVVGALSVATGATVGTANSFESPVLNATTFGVGLTMQAFIYNPPITSLQPWSFTNVLGGIALTGSPLDPPAPVTPPAGSQYAFLQTSPNSVAGFQSSAMWTTLSGLTSGSSYVISFYWAVRAENNDETEPGYDSQSQITVTVNGVNVYTSQQNLSDPYGGWTLATSNTFIATGSSAPIVFTVTSLSNDDHTILLDSVVITAPATPPVNTPSSSSAARAPSVSSSAPSNVVAVSSSPHSVPSVSSAAPSTLVSSSSTASSGTPTSSSSSSSSLSGGAIAGIVIGTLIGAAVIVVVLGIFCVGQRSKAQKWKAQTDVDHHDTASVNRLKT